MKQSQNNFSNRNNKVKVMQRQIHKSKNAYSTKPCTAHVVYAMHCKQHYLTTFLRRRCCLYVLNHIVNLSTQLIHIFLALLLFIFFYLLVLCADGACSIAIEHKVHIAKVCNIISLQAFAAL